MYQRLVVLWSKRYSNKQFTIDESSRIITVNCTGYITAFGSISISSGIFRWKIKILSGMKRDDDGIECAPSWIGIVEDKEELLKEYADYFNWHGHGYQLCGVSGVQYTKMQGVRDNTLIKKCNWKIKGDVLEMTLNLHHHTMYIEF